MSNVTISFGPNNTETLTFRETEIMDNLSQGLLYKEIADRLFISEGTVKQHVNHAYRKLRARNQIGRASCRERVCSTV